MRRALRRDTAELDQLTNDPTISRAVLSNAFQRMLECYAAPAAGRLPVVVDAAAFVAEPLVKPPELVLGVLHQGSKLVLGGGSKSFKTWTLLDLALSVSHGQPWLGFETTPGRVLYLNFEIQSWSWQRRVVAVAKAKGISIEPERLSLWNLRGKAATFDRLVPQVCKLAKQDYALIILDPIYKLYGQTDENKAGDVARLCNAIEDLTVETEASVAFGAHFSKGNQAAKESIDRISGSGVFARDPDSLLIFTKHETEDAFAVEPTLRNFSPVQPFVVRWEYPLMVPDATLDPARLKQGGGRNREHDPRKLIGAITDRTAENPISVSGWAAAADITRQTLQGYLPGLRANGWIATAGEGNAARQYLTEKGQKAARESLRETR